MLWFNLLTPIAPWKLYSHPVSFNKIYICKLFFLSPYLLPQNILFLSFQNFYHSNWLPIGILCLLAELVTSAPSGISLYWLHNDPFKYVCMLIPRICKCVTLYGKNTLQVLLNLRNLRWEEYPGMFRWAPPNHVSPEKWKKAEKGVRVMWRWRERKGSFKAWKRLCPSFLALNVERPMGHGIKWPLEARNGLGWQPASIAEPQFCNREN